MNGMKYIVWGILAVVGVVSVLGMSELVSAANPRAADVDSVMSQLSSLQSTPAAMKAIDTPKTPLPKWYKDQVAAEQAARVAGSSSGASVSGRTVTYTIRTQGSTRSNLAEFASQASQTLNDRRGWSQLGLVFKEVKSGGDFNLVLAEPAYLGTLAGCSAEWSCRVGVSVIINDDRWQGATTAWNRAGGGIRDYRHMVINHEVGHWLGHGHASCSASGAYAPIMLQQSIDLGGCKFNPWPLPGELWTNR